MTPPSTLQEERSMEIFINKERTRKKINECQICFDKFNDTLECCQTRVCTNCLCKLNQQKCPFCRQPLKNIPLVVKDSIHVQTLLAKEKEELKDHITSLYIQINPRIDINLIYSALTILEDPYILLNMSPKEIKYLVENH